MFVHRIFPSSPIDLKVVQGRSLQLTKFSIKSKKPQKKYAGPLHHQELTVLISTLMIQNKNIF